MDQLELRQGLQDIYTIMEIFRKAKKDNGQTFIDEINKMDKKLFDKQIDYYNQQGNIEKIRQIRVNLLEKLVDGKNISLEDLAFFREKERGKHKKDIFKSWNNFSILHSIFYFNYKEKVNVFFKKLNEKLIKDLGGENHMNIAITDFQGSQNFGLEGFRTAIYNNSHEKQTTALQLNLTSFKGKKENLGTNKIGIGLGSGPDYKGLKSFRSNHKIFDITQITYEDILEEFKQYEHQIFEDIFSTEHGIESKGIKSKNDLHTSNIQNTSLHNLNTILYGAPGTGKTYNMVNYALSIIENKPLIELENEERASLKKRFDQYIEQGQIVFSTFHQSLSYEEFIEGIRANTENGIINYEIEDGVFKKISEKALSNQINSTNAGISIDNLLAQFIDDVSNNLEAGNSIKLIEGATIGNINYDSNGYFRSFSLGGTVNGQRLSINIIKRDYINYRNGQINSHKLIKPRYESLSQYHGNARYYFALYQRLHEFEKSKSFVKKDKEPQKNYVLIIDEINRGNISKIFGELITLLEPSKRIGAEEELNIKLPYSQEDFGVPQNLYVLGTMNTADRSIALIDIALRRRFAFKEIEPNAELLSFKIGNIDIKRMFETINERIEFLYDREHRLGHSFFMPLKKNPTLNLLNEIFHNYIIPLLQEYFYEDREKIQIVLGDHSRQGNKNNNDKFIQNNDQNEMEVLGFNYEELENNIKYVINQSPIEKSYIGIYSSTINDTEE